MKISKASVPHPFKKTSQLRCTFVIQPINYNKEFGSVLKFRIDYTFLHSRATSDAVSVGACYYSKPKSELASKQWCYSIVLHAAQYFKRSISRNIRRLQGSFHRTNHRPLPTPATRANNMFVATLTFKLSQSCKLNAPNAWAQCGFNTDLCSTNLCFSLSLDTS